MPYGVAKGAKPCTGCQVHYPRSGPLCWHCRDKVGNRSPGVGYEARSSLSDAEIAAFQALVSAGKPLTPGRREREAVPTRTGSYRCFIRS